MHRDSITDMAAIAAQAVGYRPQQMTTSEVRALAELRRRMAARHTDTEQRFVSCPTPCDVDRPGTYAAHAALMNAAHAMAAVIERVTGTPTTAAASQDMARAVVLAYVTGFLGAERERAKDGAK